MMKKAGQILFIAGIGALSALGIVYLTQDSAKKIEVEHITTQPVVSTGLIPGSESLDFTKAAEISMNAVVHIKSSRVQEFQQQYNPFKEFFGDDFFFGPHRAPRNQQPQLQIGTGSGVILRSNGYIVTNFHVVQGADDIEVSLHDNRTFKATVTGTDPTTDLAVLKIEESNLPYLQIQNSDHVKVGEWVLAVGNPFNLNSTVTAGIVSAKARNINIIKGKSAIESFIQTDAAVNPGNSGGALVDLGGNLIGINTAIASPTGAYSGYAFAVPSNIVNKVVQDLIDYGTVQRGFLGVLIRNVDQKLAQSEGLNINHGVFIDEVLEESSAEDAGIKKGDVILQINQKETNTVPALQEIIGRLRPGDKIFALILRDGKEKQIEIQLKNKNGTTQIVAKDELLLWDELGIEVEEASNKVLKSADLEEGVLVTKITRGKISKQTQMREGFIITKIDGQIIRNKNQLQKALENKSGGVMIEGKYPELPNKYYYAFGM